MRYTEKNFRLWWNKLSETHKTVIILFMISRNEQDETSEPFSNITEEDCQEELNKPLDTKQIERLRSVKEYHYSTLNDHKRCFNFRNIKYLKHLKYLSIIDTNHYAGIAEIPWLENLQSINLIKCKNLHELKDAPLMHNPISLIIEGCRNLAFSTLNRLTNLESLHIIQSCRLTYHNMMIYPNLRHLEFTKCNNADIEIDFRLYPRLTTLKIDKTIGKIRLLNSTHAINLKTIEINRSTITNPQELQEIFDMLITGNQQSNLIQIRMPEIKSCETRKGVLITVR